MHVCGRDNNFLNIVLTVSRVFLAMVGGEGFSGRFGESLQWICEMYVLFESNISLVFYVMMFKGLFKGVKGDVKSSVF